MSCPSKAGSDHAKTIGLAVMLFGVLVMVRGGLALAILPVTLVGYVLAGMWIGASVCGVGFFALVVLIMR